MIQKFLKKEGRPSLLLIFGGWGTWPGLFSGYSYPEGSDVLLCCDYRSPDFDAGLLTGYGSVDLVAWSMGVWTAAHALSAPDLEDCPLKRRIAVNGTMYPVDDLRGIPARVFEGTLERMSRPVLDKFVRRMCGKNLEEYLSRRPERSPEELKDELAALYTAVKGSGVCPDFRWDIAVIGRDDMIFPAENQRRAWTGVRTAEMDAPHYGKELFEYAIGRND